MFLRDFTMIPINRDQRIIFLYKETLDKLYEEKTKNQDSRQVQKDLVKIKFRQLARIKQAG